VARFRAILRPPSGRITNQILLVALVLVFGTGVATVATGSPSGWWVAVIHGVAGMAILLLIPWKSRVVRGGCAAPVAPGGRRCC
jgi:heme A synthase